VGLGQRLDRSVLLVGLFWGDIDADAAMTRSLLMPCSATSAIFW
jgi:hypothetical protein